MSHPCWRNPKMKKAHPPISEATFPKLEFQKSISRNMSKQKRTWYVGEAKTGRALPHPCPPPPPPPKPNVFLVVLCGYKNEAGKK